MRPVHALAAAAALMVLPHATAAQTDPVQPFGVIGTAGGTGASPAVAEYRPEFPEQTIYRPQARPAAPLPIVLWGNGACRDNGLQHAGFLREVASHGYLVIALGKPRQVPPLRQPEAAPPPPPAAPSAAPAATPAPPPRMTADETQWTQMRDALDLASKPDGPLAGWADPLRVAVMGHSCGGLQTLAMSADPRVDTSVLFNSGVYNAQGPDSRSNIRVLKEDLAKLHAPIAYFLGGPEDIAYANGRDDADRIGHVPVFFGEIPVGHGGTFWLDDNGGEWAKVGVAWLDWRLKGDAEAGRTFSGPNCGLCTDPRWKVLQKGL